MTVEVFMKELKYVFKETLLTKKILLLNKWQVIGKYSPKSPAFSTVKYALIRENIQTLNLEEIRKLTKEGQLIYIFGLPKSGNVWVTNLVTDALGLEKGAVTFTHGGFSGKHYYNKNIFRGVCLMRDIRDIIVSLYHFSSTKGIRNDTCVYNNVESFYYDYFLSYINHFGDWNQYAERLSGWGLPIVKYERLWDNPVDELDMLFARWRFVVPLEDIEKSVEKNTIDKYKSGKTIATQEHIYPTHFRKGGYGGYIDEIPLNVLTDINRRFGEYLQRWGYELDDSKPL